MNTKLFSRRRGNSTQIIVVSIVLLLLAIATVVVLLKNTGPVNVAKEPVSGKPRQPVTPPPADPQAGLDLLVNRKNQNGNTPIKTPAKQVVDPANDRTLEVVIVDADTGKPLADSPVSIYQGNQYRKDRTDGSGRCWLFLSPSDSRYLSVNSSLKGYIPTGVIWRNTPVTEIPDRFLLKLKHGTLIGGIVKNEAGDPVAGVKVGIAAGSEEKNGEQRDFGGSQTATTNAEGIWSYDGMPEKLPRVTLQLTHPEYLSDEMFGQTPTPPEADLRAGTAVSVIRSGIEVRGVVTDMQENPITGATVAQGADRFGSNYPKAKTDKGGNFIFRNARAGQMVLTVQHRNFAPNLVQLNVKKGVEPVTIKLDKPNLLRLQIVDPEGKPIAGAWVAADTWRNYRSLTMGESNQNSSSDIDGRVEWRNAPPDEVLMDMGHKDYRSKRRVAVKASDKEVVITLERPLVIRGTVTDAETGRAIPKFKVYNGNMWPGNPTPYWDTYNAQIGSAGKYEAKFTEQTGQAGVRIVADGYLPVSSPFFDGKADINTFDAKLKKGTGPTGIVIAQDGKPVAGAAVAVGLPNRPVYMNNNEPQQNWGGESFDRKTDANGKFTLLPQTENCTLVITHKQGYAVIVEVKPEQQNIDVKLQPWSKLEGLVKVGSKPRAADPVQVYVYQQQSGQRGPQHNFNYQATTDAEGKFVIEQVPAGMAGISRGQVQVQQGQGSYITYTHTINVRIAAGQTTKVQVGGVGRPIIGQVVLPDTAEAKRWMVGQGNLMLQETVSSGAAGALKRLFKPNSPVAQVDESRMRYFNIVLQEDGKFRLDDVPSGTYNLMISYYEPSGDQRAGLNADWSKGPRASVQKEVVVPAIPGGQSDEVLDLGKLEVKQAEKAEPKPAQKVELKAE